MRKGFTIIELLIAIAILGILASIIISVIQSGKVSARKRDAQRVSDLSKLQVVIESYAADAENNSPPNNLPSLVPTYIGAVPVDPTNQGSLVYTYQKGSTQYELSAVLEANPDKMANDGGNDCYLYEVGNGKASLGSNNPCPTPTPSPT